VSRGGDRPAARRWGGWGRGVVAGGRRVATIGVVALATLAAGCGGGGGIQAADLFILERTGSVPGARLTLLVNEEGGVRCNGGATLKLSDPALVQARAIQEDLREPASNHVSLPAQAGSVLSYYLRDENGSVRFADNSAGQPAAFHNLVLFVLQTAQQVCHLPI
jgi:hypothetical protein